MTAISALLLFIIVAAAWATGRRRSLVVVGGDATLLRSRPIYHGHFVALWSGIPALALLLLGIVIAPSVVEALVRSGAAEILRDLPPERAQLFLSDAAALASGGITTGASTPELGMAARHWETFDRRIELSTGVAVLALAGGGLLRSRRLISAEFRARDRVEKIVLAVLAASSVVAVLVTIGIVFSLLFEATRFFARVPVSDFLFGVEWSPQTAIREDQVGSSGAFGAVPVFSGTLLITGIAMFVAVPVGLLSAIYLSEYATSRLRAWVKPLLEILAGIPTVVYGFFAAVTVAPLVREIGEGLGLEVALGSALVAGLVMGVMIIPFVSSLSDDVINSVPQSLRDGSLGLGATPSETIRRVVIPAALPGIVSAVLLAVSRAIGETMIVVMAVGTAANLTANPLEAVTTVTVQIVTLLTGDQEFDSAKTLSAFALGLVLFVVTLALNIVALGVVRRYREQYD